MRSDVSGVQIEHGKTLSFIYLYSLKEFKITIVLND